jgi:hypothetical protein
MKLEFASSNPIAPDKYIGLIETTANLCNVQNLKSKFLRKAIIEIFKKSSNVTLKCPFEKTTYQMNDWLIDADKMIPTSFAIPGNVSLYLEFLVKSDSSSKTISMFSLKTFLEIRK